MNFPMQQINIILTFLIDMKSWQILIVLSSLMHASHVKGSDISKKKIELKEATTDQQKLEAILEICDYYNTNSQEDVDSLIQYSSIALGLSEKVGTRVQTIQSKTFYGKAHSFLDSTIYFQTMSEVSEMYMQDENFVEAARTVTQLGMWYAFKLDMVKIREHAARALTILDQVQPSTKDADDLRSLIYYYIANSYNYGESYATALEYAFKMKDVAESQNLEKRILMSYEIMGKIYTSLKKISFSDNDYASLAETYFQKAYDLAKTTDYKDVQFGSAFNLGQHFYLQGDYKRAQDLLEESLQGAIIEKSEAFKFNSLIYLGLNAVEFGEYGKAERLCHRAHEISKYTKSSSNETSVNSLYAKIFTGQKKYSEARKFGLITLSQTLDQNNLELQVAAYRNLEEIETLAGRYVKAIDYDKSADSIQVKLLNEKTISGIRSITSAHEIEQKQKEIAFLKQQTENQRLKSQNRFMFLGAALLLAIAGFIWSILKGRNTQIKQEKNYIQLEQKLLRSQMNPHFIFNAISSIQNYLYDKSDLSIALNYMSKFADLMRQILENSREQYISLAEEIRSLENYLELQQLRYGNTFGYQIEVDSTINPNEVMVPPLVAQPFVENAIEHGMIYRIENGSLNVLFKSEESVLGVYIQDNGIGGRKLDLESKHVQRKKTSLATKIMQERLMHLSSIKKKNYQMVTETLVGGGTLVSIQLPNIKSA